jgi:hypothetical protein
MKKCPTCSRTYADESITFCLADGSLLSASYDTQATLQIPSPRDTNPTELLSSDKSNDPSPPSGDIPPLPTPQEKRGKVSVFIVVAIGASALLGALGTWAWFEKGSKSSTGNVPIAAENSSVVTSENNSHTTPTTLQKTGPPPIPKSISTAQSEVKTALDDWLQTTIERDFSDHMKYYADMLDIYYRESNVNLSHVREVNRSMFETYSVMEVSTSNLRIDVNPTSGRVVTTFDKQFDFRGANSSRSGSVQSELRWEKINEAWRITSERDLQIYYVSK